MKKTLYPKTVRVKVTEKYTCQLTEKLDGSNLCIFKKDDVLYVAQRNNIFSINELEENKNALYPGLYNWINNYKDYLMFAKANITEDFTLKNIYYYHELFIYPFKNQEIPDFIGIVPIVRELKVIPSKKDLDVIYAEYCEKVNRPVEGIIVNYTNNITKYVRMKNGKLQDHFDRGE